MQATRQILALQDIGNEWNPFPPGTRVRCSSPDNYAKLVADMVRGRVGAVSCLQSNSGRPVVTFPAAGARKAYRWVPDHPSHLQVIAKPVA